MFENVIGQDAVLQLAQDIKENKLPPSILFSGPECSGKLTAALELARSVSCMKDSHWTCTCSSCLRQKELISPDVIILGVRDHSPEIKAASAALIKNKTLPLRYLFLRAVRKLTTRFDSRVWDADESKFIKVVPFIAEIEELISDLCSCSIEDIDDKILNKIVEAICLKSIKLQDECMYDTIPINQVRKASSWVRLMPSGIKKILIVENADKMQEGARNAFLKILEEPPSYSVFVLTTAHRGAIMPTILSRVRTYNFAERKISSQEEVIKRVFKGDVNQYKAFGKFNLLSSYLYGFLPVSFQTIQNTASLFYEYIFLLIDKQNKILPSALYNSISNYKNENYYDNSNCAILNIVSLLNKCKPHTIYVLFLNSLLSFLQLSLKNPECSACEVESYFRITDLIKKAETAVDVFNISPQSALENLAECIKEELI